MSIAVTPLNPANPGFAAAIGGIDLHQPLADGEFAAIWAAMDRYAVCVIHSDPPLDDEEHKAFSRRFGPLMNSRRAPVFKVADNYAETPRFPTGEVIDVSNLDHQGGFLSPDHRRSLFKKGDMLWHADVSFNRNRATYSLLNSLVVPPSGGDTGFADLRAAYDALPEATRRRIEPLVARHSIWYSRRRTGFPDPTPEELASNPPVRHRLVHTHPRSGRRSLYVGSHAGAIEGMGEAEGLALIDELIAHAGRPEFTYFHRWRAGDLVIWDNYCTMHRATPFDDQVHPRDVRRTTVREWDDSLPVAEIDRLVAERERAAA